VDNPSNDELGSLHSKFRNGHPKLHMHYPKPNYSSFIIGEFIVDEERRNLIPT